jgi:transposase
VINGILGKRRTGAPWRDLPDRYGPWQTCVDRLVRWRRDGAWDRLLQHAQTTSDAVGDVVWEVSVDSTPVRAHQHAAGARKRLAKPEQKKWMPDPLPQEGLGRSRGGLTTTIHLACDGKGRPLSIVITSGLWGDNPQLGPVLDGICVAKPDGKGHPRRRPTRLLADKGYSHPSTRRLLRQRGIPHCIPERRDQRDRRTHHAGRKPAFAAPVYKGRNVVERCTNRRKQFRGLATRYEKRGWNYRALVVIAAVMLWLPR